MLLKRFFICYYRQNGLYREAPPESGTFFWLQVYQMVGSFLVSSESNFKPETPREVIFLDEFFFNEFFIFSSESTHKAITFAGKKFFHSDQKIFDSDQKQCFFDYFKSSKFAAILFHHLH